MKAIKVVFFLMLTWCLCALNGFADVEDVLKKSFSVEPGGTLFLESNLGSVDIRTQAGPTVHIEMTRTMDTNDHGRAAEILNDLKLDLRQEGKNVILRAEYRREKSWWRFWGHNRLKIRYQIIVPARYNVDVGTGGGSITISDLEGDVKAHTSGGSLNMGKIRGTVYGRTSGGSVTLEGCQGRANVHTSGGSIRIGKVAGPVEANTSGGSIEVEEVMGTIQAETSGGHIGATLSHQPDADCRLSSSGGGIQVYIRQDLKLTIDAHTSGGNVRSDLPLTVSGELSRNRLNAKLNGGGPLLYLRTSGGNISINKLGGEKNP